MRTIQAGESVVIFPEDSKKGYLPELEGFFGGCLALAKHLAKKGIDLPIVVSYYHKSSNLYVFDTPVRYSELLTAYGDHEKILAHLLARCNELGRLSPEALNLPDKQPNAA